jgi:hypothetical protein
VKVAKYFLVGAALLLFLIIHGFLRIPAALSGGLLSLAGAAVALLLFGLFGWLGVPVLERSSGEQAVRLGGFCGRLAGRSDGCYTGRKKSSRRYSFCGRI